MRCSVWVAAWIFCCCGLHQLDTGNFGALRTVVSREAGGQKQSASRDYMTKHDLPPEQRILILLDKFQSAKNRAPLERSNTGCTRARLKPRACVYNCRKPAACIMRHFKSASKHTQGTARASTTTTKQPN